MSNRRAFLFSVKKPHDDATDSLSMLAGFISERPKVVTVAKRPFKLKILTIFRKCGIIYTLNLLVYYIRRKGSVWLALFFQKYRRKGMEVNKKAERVPRYCPLCKTEWQPNATCCSKCGVKKVSRPKTQSGTKNERDMEYTTQTFKFEGFTVNVRRPILTAEEREKREQAVIDTLTSIARRGGSFIKEDAEQ
jgi:predicted Zn-ribbon and HTH transcriptional regulator